MITKEQIIAFIKDNLGDILKDLDLGDNTVEDVAYIYGEVDDAFEDGFQWSDISRLWGGAVASLVEMATNFSTLTGEQKKEFVIKSSWTLYKLIDQDVDGSKNRINIPIVFGSLEEKIEEYMVTTMLPMAIEAAYSAFKDGKKATE